MLSQVEAHRLAASINQLRPDWPLASLSTWIRKHLPERAYRDAAVALTWVACDPETTSPGRVLEAGPWWRAVTADKGTTSTVTTRCPEHPAHAAWNCPDCDAATTPPPENWRDGLTLTRRDRPKARTEPTPDPTRIEQIRAELDREATT